MQFCQSILIVAVVSVIGCSSYFGVPRIRRELVLLGHRLFFWLLLIALPIQANAMGEYYKKPCIVQANDARTLTELRDKGHSMTALRQHVEKTRSLEDQDALLNVLAYIFTTFKAKTPGDVFEATLFSCEQHGKDTSLGPVSSPSLSIPRGYLSVQEEQSCTALRDQLQVMANELASYERRIDQMAVTVDASYARLTAMGKNPPSSMVAEHNRLAAAGEQLSSEYAAIGQKYNKETDRYNENCAGKATRGLMPSSGLPTPP